MRQKVELKIRKKWQEIQDLEDQKKALDAKIHDARIYIQALEDSKRLFPKEGTDDENFEEPVTLKVGTALAGARDVIYKAGKPLYIDEILKQMGREVTKKARVSLVGSISAYARDGKIFKKAGKNTFGLIEMPTPFQLNEIDGTIVGNLRVQ